MAIGCHMQLAHMQWQQTKKEKEENKESHKEEKRNVNLVPLCHCCCSLLFAALKRGKGERHRSNSNPSLKMEPF